VTQAITSKQKSPVSSNQKIRSYSEVVSFLDSLKSIEYGENSLKRMQQLDTLFENASTKIDVILVGGTNGKSSSIHFASKLLREENFNVGISYSSHTLTYNERLLYNAKQISNKTFTDTVNEVINVAQTNNINATSFEIVTMASILNFKNKNIDVALFEVGIGGKYDATNIFTPIISAITRIAEDHTDVLSKDLDEATFEMLEIAKPGAWFISAEQSKIRLQKMKAWAEERGVKWSMPIRKLSALPYIYEQLYGRTASLGERIAQIYIEDIKQKFSPFLRGNLLATKKGQRGRPTLQAKRDSELNPIKTLKKFWLEEFDLLRGRFEILNTEKPSVLLDNARNIDALDNVFLGVRLLHYQKPINGLALIIGLHAASNDIESVKLIRYLLKKVPGEVIFVPLANNEPCHNPQDLAIIAKDMNIRAQICADFTEAFEIATRNVDERDGLVVVSGSQNMVSEYWRNRGIKKF
jgi:dihydrofolate synthase / folylpolyglutamate synthase